MDLINYSDYGLGQAGSAGCVGSLDSSDMSQPSYPTQGSLFGLERVALETMGPAGSITNSVYINPFQPRNSQESVSSSSKDQRGRTPRRSQVG